MVNIATEMNSRGMTTPLLIGGATTSRLLLNRLKLSILIFEISSWDLKSIARVDAGEKYNVLVCHRDKELGCPQIAKKIVSRHCCRTRKISTAIFRKHTAVKIWPAYPDLCIYVPDASRAVNVVTSLVNKDQKYIGDIRKLYEKVQLDHVKTLQVIHRQTNR